MRRRLWFAGSLALAAGAVLVACGTDGSRAGPGAPRRVVAGFYPLQWMAEQVGGERVAVTNLTRGGVEPHDLDLTPSDAAAVVDADVTVYLAGFQPAVDDAVAGATGRVFDATAAADLDLRLGGSRRDGGAGPGGTPDPHFWLDPIRLARVARSFAGTLAVADPGHAATYQANARSLAARLRRLDREFRAVLADCPARQLVTSHQAFGYLARRYGLEQVGVAGVSPDQEPSAADLARVATFVEDHRVRTIYVETLVSPAVARTVAAEAGARTAVLDPLEGLTDASKGRDYLAVMRSNLEQLRTGQPCP